MESFNSSIAGKLVISIGVLFSVMHVLILLLTMEIGQPPPPPLFCPEQSLPNN